MRGSEGTARSPCTNTEGRGDRGAVRSRRSWGWRAPHTARAAARSSRSEPEVGLKSHDSAKRSTLAELGGGFARPKRSAANRLGGCASVERPGRCRGAEPAWTGGLAALNHGTAATFRRGAGAALGWAGLGWAGRGRALSAELRGGGSSARRSRVGGVQLSVPLRTAAMRTRTAVGAAACAGLRLGDGKQRGTGSGQRAAGVAARLRSVGALLPFYLRRVSAGPHLCKSTCPFGCEWKS